MAAAIRYELIFSLAHSTLAILFRSINNVTHLSSARVQAISLHSIFTISTLSNAECVCVRVYLSPPAQYNGAAFFVVSFAAN